jgi:type I restriction enzyme, S subunit
MRALGGAYGEVPLRRVLAKLNRAVDPADGVVTAFRDGQVTLRSSRREDGFTMSDQEAGYQGVEPGDLVIHGLDAFAGAVGVADARGKCSPVYHVCRTLLGADARYIAYALRAEAHAGYLALQAGNVRQRAVDFRNWETLGDVAVPTPPPHLQQTIADFLDLETSRIDRLADLLARRMSVLRERRVAAISSQIGVDHPITRLKYVASVNRMSLPESTSPDLKFRYIDISAVDSWGRISTGPEMEFADAPSRARRLASQGDIVISTVRTYLRAVAPVLDSPSERVFSTGFAVLTPRPTVFAGYLRWAVQSSEFVDQVVARSVGINYPSINTDDLMDISVRTPSLGEQAKIAARLDQLSDGIERAVQQAERELSAMTERRQALINAAVTGQVEIPGVAA